MKHTLVTLGVVLIAVCVSMPSTSYAWGFGKSKQVRKERPQIYRMGTSKLRKGPSVQIKTRKTSSTPYKPDLPKVECSSRRVCPGFLLDWIETTDEKCGHCACVGGSIDAGYNVDMGVKLCKCPTGMKQSGNRRICEEGWTSNSDGRCNPPSGERGRRGRVRYGFGQ